jgi:sortase (surface protein transpeptidase)
LTLVTCYPFDDTGSAPEGFILRAVFRGTPDTLDLDKMRRF